MKIICKQEKLIKTLNIVSRAVSQTSTLPIMKGILIKTEGDIKISLSATDVQLSITTGMDAIVNEKGGVVVGARIFMDLVRKLPPGDILITTDEKNNVSIKTENSDYDISGKKEEEFPRIETDEEGNQIRLNKDVFREMIDGTAFAAATDESKGILTGVLFEIKEGMLSLVALDGLRVAIRREKTDILQEEAIKAIIPGRMMKEISRILGESEGEEEIMLDIGESRLRLFAGETLVRASLLAGEYVKYQNILKDSKIRVVTSRAELLSAVERASMLKSEGKESGVRFSMGEKAITISSRAEEGKGKETVFAEKEGEDLEIGFNARLVIDALKTISDEDIELNCNTGISPCLVKPIEGDRFEYLIMPVKLSSFSV